VACAGAFGRLRDGDGQHAAFDARLRPVEGKPRRQWHGPDEAAAPALGWLQERSHYSGSKQDRRQNFPDGYLVDDSEFRQEQQVGDG